MFHIKIQIDAAAGKLCTVYEGHASADLVHYAACSFGIKEYTAKEAAKGDEHGAHTGSGFLINLTGKTKYVIMSELMFICNRVRQNDIIIRSYQGDQTDDQNHFYRLYGDYGKRG